LVITEACGLAVVGAPLVMDSQGMGAVLALQRDAMAKLGVQSRSQVIAYAQEWGAEVIRHRHADQKRC